MIYSARRRAIVDFLGTHQHMAVDLDLQVDDEGRLRITSGPRRFCEGRVGSRFPRALSGGARLHEWYDARTGEYRIDVAVMNSHLGPLFGYRGRFTVEFITAPADRVPASVKPVRENPTQ